MTYLIGWRLIAHVTPFQAESIVQQQFLIAVADYLTVEDFRIVGVQTVDFKEIRHLHFIPCHRMPSRSPKWFGKQIPLCYRCLFMILGYLGIPVLLAIPVQIPLYVGILLNVPMLVDGITQGKGLRLSNNALRTFTGILSGIGQSIIVVDVALWIGNLLLKWT